MKFVKIPKSTAAILEGESLLNDASSLIIFKFALIAVGTGQFIFHEALLDFSWMVIGGIGIGLLFGWLFVQAHKRLPTDASSDIVLTIIEPYFLYWVAEHTHSSGVLAVVSGGFFVYQAAHFFKQRQPYKRVQRLGIFYFYPEWNCLYDHWAGAA
jgi:NhaP-type Na+/H+ or K+/H+ antiporter